MDQQAALSALRRLGCYSERSTERDRQAHRDRRPPATTPRQSNQFVRTNDGKNFQSSEVQCQWYARNRSDHSRYSYSFNILSADRSWRCGRKAYLLYCGQGNGDEQTCLGTLSSSATILSVDAVLQSIIAGVAGT